MDNDQDSLHSLTQPGKTVMVFRFLLFLSILFLISDLLVLNHVLLLARWDDPRELLNGYFWADWYGVCLWIIASGLWCEILVKWRVMRRIVFRVFPSRFLYRRLLVFSRGRRLMRYISDRSSGFTPEKAVRAIRYATVVTVVLFAWCHVLALHDWSVGGTGP